MAATISVDLSMTMTHALAIAGSHASGTMEYDQSGGEVKRKSILPVRFVPMTRESAK